MGDRIAPDNAPCKGRAFPPEGRCLAFRRERTSRHRVGRQDICVENDSQTRPIGHQQMARPAAQGVLQQRIAQRVGAEGMVRRCR